MTETASPISTADGAKIKLPHALTAEEASLLNYFFDDEFFSRLMRHAANNAVSRDAIATMLSHAAFESAEVSTKILSVCMRQCTRAGVAELLSCLKIIREVLTLPDSLQTRRVTQFVAGLTELMTQWLPNSYIAYNYVADSFLELLQKCPPLLATFRGAGNKLGFVKEWLCVHDYPDPSVRFIMRYMCRCTGWWR